MPLSVRGSGPLPSTRFFEPSPVHIPNDRFNHFAEQLVSETISSRYWYQLPRCWYPEAAPLLPYTVVTSGKCGHGSQVYLVASNCCNWRSFFAEHCGKIAVLPRTSSLNLREKERRVRKGVGETWVKQ